MSATVMLLFVSWSITLIMGALFFFTRGSNAKQRIDKALAAGRVGLWEWDIVTGKGVWNSEMERLYGLSHQPGGRLPFEEWAKFVVPEDRDRIAAETQQTIESGQRLETQFRVRRTTGEVVWIRAVATVEKDQQGRPLKMIGLNWDVTEEVRLREEVEGSRSYFEAVLGTLNNPVYVKDEKHNVVYCNEAFCEFVGRSRKEVLSQPEWTFFPDKDVDECRRRDVSVLKTGQENEVEEILRDGQGELRTILSKRSLYRGDGVNQIVCEMVDVTELMRLQNISVQNEKQSRTFIEQLPVAVAMFDFSLRCLAASRAWIVQHGLEDTPILGDEMWVAFPAIPENWRAAHRRALMGQVVRWDEDQATSADGKSRWMNWEVRPWYQGEHVGGFVIMTESVTEKKKMMEELEQTRARQVEASRLVSIGQMAAGVAHEINNPLTVIMGKAWMIEEKINAGQEVAAPQLLDSMKKVTQYAQRIGKIVKALRAFSRDPSTDPMSHTNLGDIWNDTMSMCGERFRNHGVKLTIEGTPADSVLRCRPTQVSQILVNLLNNAFDASRAAEGPASVEVRFETVGGFQEIRVIDSGPGVAPGLENRIFEPFFTTKEIGKGTGLGLSISTGLAKDHGGTLSLDLERSRSCFLLRLPTAAAAEKESA